MKCSPGEFRIPANVLAALQNVPAPGSAFRPNGVGIHILCPGR